MNSKPLIVKCVGAAALVMVWAIPATGHAGHGGNNYRVYSGHRLPTVQVFSYGISNPYSSRRYRSNRHYHNRHGSKQGIHHRGFQKKKSYRRGFKQGYRQGIRDGRRSRVHQGHSRRGYSHRSHGIRLRSGISGYHSSRWGGYIGYRY
ncbi:MAG: hypothetical protein VW985_11350 [Gammaproteobacteria bacterium]